MNDIRPDLLAMHMHNQKLTDHQVATALGVRVEAVRKSLLGFGWFGPAVERRLSQFLEVSKTEWELME